MEMLETESLSKESLTKSTKKKKDLDEQTGKNIRKISDFFKTPEKQVEKQRQKSLLQFFGKQDKLEKEEISSIASSDVPVVNGTDETTPTNSDKENNEVFELDRANIESGENKSKLKKRPKNIDSGGEENNDELQIKNTENDKEINDSKRHNKHKKKRKTKDEKADHSLSDSVILLSDSSSSNLPFLDGNDKLKETIVGNNEVKSDKEKAYFPASEKNNGSGHDTEGQGDNKIEEEEIRDEIEMETEDDEITATSSNNSKLMNKVDNNILLIEEKDKQESEVIKEELKVKMKVKTNNDNILNVKDKERFNVKHVENDKSQQINKSSKIKESEIKKSKKSISECKNDSEVNVKESEKIKQGKDRQTGTTSISSEHVDNQIVKKKSKKCALKGKDMLNLLKEIQSGESEEKNKRKHRKKHKHHRVKDKTTKVLEIAVSEDNSDGKEDVIVVAKETENQDKKKSESKTCKEASNRVTRRRSKVRKDDKDMEKAEEDSLKEDVIEKPIHMNLKSSEESVKDLVPSGSNQLSYQDFTDTLDSKISKDQEVKKEKVKEMSYSEYLEMMEKSNVGEKSEDLIETDTENLTESEIIDDIKIDQGMSDNDSEKVEKDAENVDNKKFFAFMTSTPDREKLNKKTGKAVGKRGRKPKAEKLKSSMKDDVTVELIESKKMKIDLDVEVLDAKEEKRLHSESVTCNVSSKSFFTGKKTQATLSFCKSGLTVSKAISKSDEEDSKDKSFVALKVDKVEKQISIREKVVTVPLNKRGRKPKQVISEVLNASDSSVFATPEKVVRKGKRQLEEDETESGDNEDRRRSLRKRYKVEAFQMDADKKTPIKIKLKRCPKSSSSGDDIEKSALNLKKVKPTANQTTALALLVKAKRGRLKKHKVTKDKELFSLKNYKEIKKLQKNQKKRNESNSSEDSLTRRSSRLEGKCMASMEEVSLENIVISSSEDEDSNVKVVKKRGRPKGSKNVKSELPKTADKIDTLDNKGTPKKDVVKKKVNTPSKTRTPSKKDTKLAPMFLMGKNKATEPSPKKPPLDPELVKQRQQFLMSGVPEALRKQTATRIASLVDADYPPLPTTSHVLQVPKDLVLAHESMVNVWDLNPVELSLRHFIIPFIIHPLARFTANLITRCDDMPERLDRIVPPVQIPDDMIELCKGEIASFNSKYPVAAMYKAVKEMKIETEKPPPKSESMLKTDMKGILEGCNDMMVIDDDDGGDEGKRKKKKSLKLQKKDKREEKIEEPKVEDKNKAVGSSLLWTEKYCPSKTAEVLGNSGVLKKLKIWLTEWKHLLDKEARKARKLLMKKNKGKQLNKKINDDLWNDDSDFDMDSDDSDDDYSLCNTMLLSGPHGCGKTSSVYALALELGFKVHEVNASSCRSGKQILSQLQEATQSHQVSSQGNHTPRKNTALGDKTKPENKLPTAFTNLFKKSAPSADKQEGKHVEKLEEKQAGKKRKRNKSDKESNQTTKGDNKESELKHKSLQLIIEDSNSQSVAKSLNLSSTTLILFDEVDVVFDEDKGFLSAIQSFMSKTKIPIILTTADPGFTSTFEGRYEQMVFKRPSVASITSHLQTVSLVENLRTDPLMLAELAQFYNCDMRRCLITLQYLVESGGSHLTSSQVIASLKDRTKSANLLGLETENSQSGLQSENSVDNVRENKPDTGLTGEDQDNSDDDFVSIKPSRKRRRVLEDESSNSVDAPSKVVMPVLSESTAVDINDKKYPLVHCLGLESLISARSICIADMLSQGLKEKTELSLLEMICTNCFIKQNSGSDLFYNNLHYILPFTTKVVDSVFKLSQDKVKTKTRQRIRIESDLYDSEASNDASKAEDIAESKGDNPKQTNEESYKQGCKEENLCLAKSLSHFTQFYDTMSSLDLIESVDSKKVCDKLQGYHGKDVKGTLLAGMGNELAPFPTHCELDLETAREYSAEIGTRSMCKMYSDCVTVKEEVEKLCIENETFEENFVLPVNRQNEHFTLVDNSNISIAEEYKRACDNTVDNLPLVSHSHLRSVHLDYLPTLREICRTEQCRQVANTKRRFHHYLDSITLPLKDRTISTLATTFV